MSVFDIPLSSVPPEQIHDHLRKLKEFIRETDEPNATGADGKTCLQLALAFCNDSGGESRIALLLERGADPNLPTPLDNFWIYITTAKCTQPFAMLIGAGLKLNEIYDADPDYMPTGRVGPITLLDFALDIEAYLKSRSKGFTKFAKKHGVALAPRQQFIAETIDLLRSNGAVCAEL